MPELEGTSLLAVAAAIAATVVAVGLALRVAAEGRRTGRLREQIDDLLKDSRGGRKQREQREKALRQAESERDRAASKLAQAEKRAAQSRGDARREREAAEERATALETDLTEARREAGELQARLARTRGELDAAIEHVTRAEARATAAEDVEPVAPPVVDSSEVSALSERLAGAERSVAERQVALGKATDQVTRLKGRLETQDRLYASIRSELALKKDQLRQQREELERLRAYKVALVDAGDEPSDQEPAD